MPSPVSTPSRTRCEIVPLMAQRLAATVGHRHFVLWCFAVFAGIRAALVVLVPLHMWSDAEWYLARAMNIASGEGYSEGGLPTAYWPVGYPGFLAGLFVVFGKASIVGKVANLVLACGTFYLVLQLTRNLFKSETAARIAVLLLAVYPNNAAYAPILLTETYFTFLLLLGTYLLLMQRGWAWSIASGLVFGLAVLTKPQIVFLPAILVGLQIISAQERISLVRSATAGIVVYVALVAVLVPWSLRNERVFGERVLLSTNGGMSLLIANNPSVHGGFDERDPLVAKARFSVADQVAADRRARALALAWISTNPGRFLVLMPLKAWELWWKDGEAEWAYQAGFPAYDRFKYAFRSIRIVNQLYYWLLLAAFLASLPRLFMRRDETRWPYSAFGILVVAYFTLISMVFSGQTRYHFPAMPWIIMYAGWLLASRHEL